MVLEAADGETVTIGKPTDAANQKWIADGKLYTISEKSGKLMSYDEKGAASIVMEDILGHSILATPTGGLYVTDNDAKKPNSGGSVWFVKDGKKTQVDKGLKFATGMAYRPDQWLLSVADGHSKWVYRYQLNADGALTNKKRFFHLHVADWEDDAGAECVCYSLESRQFNATKL
jgi:gluconolactonase